MGEVMLPGSMGREHIKPTILVEIMFKGCDFDISDKIIAINVEIKT